MVTRLDTTDRRAAAGFQLMADGGSWARVQMKDGQKFFGIPSRTRPNLLHFADMQSCSCEDHRNRGVDCAHVWAVRFYVLKRKGEKIQQPRRFAPGVLEGGIRSKTNPKYA